MTRAAALVEEHVAAHELRVVLRQPDRALAAADLLVDDDDDEQVAARRAPALARERDRRDDLGGGLRLHVERAAAPQLAVDDVAAPRVVAPLGGIGEHGVDVREQAEHRAVGARRAAARRGSGARACSRRASPRTRRSGSSAASSSWAASSFPGGLTVLWRTSCASSRVASSPKGSMPPIVRPSWHDARPACRAERVGLGTVLREWGRLGVIGFGGPPAHVALLRELCVERRGWIDAREFEDANAAAQLLPGPGLDAARDLLRGARRRARRRGRRRPRVHPARACVLIIALAALTLGGSTADLGARRRGRRGRGGARGDPARRVRPRALEPRAARRDPAVARGRLPRSSARARSSSFGAFVVLALLVCGLAELVVPPPGARRRAGDDGRPCRRSCSPRRPAPPRCPTSRGRR